MGVSHEDVVEDVGAVGIDRLRGLRYAGNSLAAWYSPGAVASPTIWRIIGYRVCCRLRRGRVAISSTWGGTSIVPQVRTPPSPPSVPPGALSAEYMNRQPLRRRRTLSGSG